MKYLWQGWTDTKNVDLALVPESEVDKVLLTLICTRQPKWSSAYHSSGKVEIIFPPEALNAK
jgi:hypothetical protein